MTTYPMTAAAGLPAAERLQEARARRAVKAREAMAKVYTFMQFFYPLILVAALVGQTLAGTHYLGWPWWTVAPIAFGLEFAGVAVAILAEARQMLKERALLLRLFSGGVAAFAVWFNVVGHGDSPTQRIVGALFGFFTGLGYLLYLATSAAKRRDALREDADLAEKPPSYELLQWARHPFVTTRARSMAKADPSLGLYGSLDAARDAMQREERNSKLAEALKAKIKKTVGAGMADIAILTFEMDEVAKRLRDGADYDGLTALLRADLDPVLLATGTRAGDEKAEKAEKAEKDQVDAGSGRRPVQRIIRNVRLVPVLPAAEPVAQADELDWRYVPVEGDDLTTGDVLDRIDRQLREQHASDDVIELPETTASAHADAEMARHDGQPAEARVPALAAAKPRSRKTLTAAVNGSGGKSAATRLARPEGRPTGPVAAAEAAWRQSVVDGKPLSGKALGALFGLSQSWGGNVIRATRARLQQQEAVSP